MNASHFSSRNVFNFLNFLSKSIASAKCIVVLLMLNVVFDVYVNFIIFGFKGLACIIFLI